jgi:Na+-transporting methylmalonyl-CoA/oxaloacetate decarboxylase gamma subunit
MLSFLYKSVKSVTFLVLFVLIFNGLGLSQTTEYSGQTEESTEETIEIREEAIVSEKRNHVKKKSLVVRVIATKLPHFASSLYAHAPGFSAKQSRPILYRALLI